MQALLTNRLLPPPLQPNGLWPVVARLIAIATVFALLTSPRTDLPTGIENPLDATDHLMADQLASAVSSSEWLGILAPIAISPFFGIACLCFLSQYGDSLAVTNSFISTNPVLQEPIVLWIFAALTILTSLPRLTKVSKPVAQACDQIETWAAIITVVIIKVAAANATGIEPGTGESTAQVVQMGFVTVTGDVLLSIAAVINIVVINTVRFFFELMVWLTPFPFVDALLEFANKGTCAGLVAVYAWSPLAATILNLLLFAVCAFLFVRVRRWSTYLRAVVVDPVCSLLLRNYGVPGERALTVFPDGEFGPFPSRAKLTLQKVENGWQLNWHRWLLPDRQLLIDAGEVNAAIDPGLIVNRIDISGKFEGSLLFTRRYNSNLQTLADQLSISPRDRKVTPEVTTT